MNVDPVGMRGEVAGDMRSREEAEDGGVPSVLEYGPRVEMEGDRRVPRPAGECTSSPTPANMRHM